MKFYSVNFIDLLIQLMTELILDLNIKSFYLKILIDLAKNSIYNTSFLSDEIIVQRLFIFIRLENNKEIRELTSELLYILMINFSKVNFRYF